jgi:hypothetical protein
MKGRGTAPVADLSIWVALTVSASGRAIHGLNACDDDDADPCSSLCVQDRIDHRRAAVLRGKSRDSRHFKGMSAMASPAAWAWPRNRRVKRPPPPDERNTPTPDTSPPAQARWPDIIR